MSEALEIRSLTKKFGGLTATDSLSFQVEEGESVGLIGPNGAGKTTVFSQIMGEFFPTSGSVYFQGRNISRLSTSRRIRLGISRTYQVPRPFPELTVAENIRVGMMPDSVFGMVFKPHDPESELEIALSVGFAPEDMEKPVSELSMGDLRKLEMARTIATGATTLLLDEVFAGLTSAEISQISSLIDKMRSQGMTFLIVSHDLPALEPLVDRAIAIDQGRLVSEGSFSQVIKSPAVRDSYLGGA